MDYYFSPSSSPVRTLVAASASAAAPCPFSGHYAIGGAREAIDGLLSGGGGGGGAAAAAEPDGFGCPRASSSMQAGCSGSSGLRVETRCEHEVGNNR